MLVIDCSLSVYIYSVCVCVCVWGGCACVRVHAHMMLTALNKQDVETAHEVHLALMINHTTEVSLSLVSGI